MLIWNTAFEKSILGGGGGGGGGGAEIEASVLSSYLGLTKY
jgi:hypothetical protein